LLSFLFPHPPPFLKGPSPHDTFVLFGPAHRIFLSSWSSFRSVPFLQLGLVRSDTRVLVRGPRLTPFLLSHKTRQKPSFRIVMVPSFFPSLAPLISLPFASRGVYRLTVAFAGSAEHEKYWSFFRPSGFPIRQHPRSLLSGSPLPI